MLDLGNNTNASVNYGSANSSAVPQAGARARQVFNLSASVLADQRAQTSSSSSKQIDPALFARIALEEELKRRGGGGGGVRSYNPMNFIPYSFKLMSEALDRIRQAFNQAMSQAFVLPAPVNNFVQQVQNYVANLFNTPVLQNLNTAINQSFAQIAQALQNPGQTAAKLANNLMQIANTIASAVAAGLKKVFASKEDDKFDPDNEYFQEDDDFLSKAWGIFSNVGNDANQSNARNIKSHIDNLAKQVVRFLSGFRQGF